MAAGHKHETIRLECGLTPSDAYTFCGSEDGELFQKAAQILDSEDHFVFGIFPTECMHTDERRGLLQAGSATGTWWRRAWWSLSRLMQASSQGWPCTQRATAC